MCISNVVRHQNNHEFAEWGSVFHQADEIAAVAEKINTFVTKKNS